MTELDSVGTIVSWEPPHEVAFSKLRQVVIDCGFDAKYARDMLPRDAFSRAAKELCKDRIIRRVDEDDNEIQFQFTKEWLEHNEFQYEKECEMFLDKQTGVIRSDSPDLATAAHDLLIAHQAKRNTSDITRMVQKIFDDRKGDLVPLRRNGGVYFVPQSHQDLVDKTHTLMVAIGGSLSRFSIKFGDDKTDKSIAEAMADHLIGLIDDLKMSYRDLSSESSDKVKQRRIDKILEMRDKLQSYEGLLSGYTDSIKAEIDRAENELVLAIAEPGSITDDMLLPVPA